MNRCQCPGCTAPLRPIPSAPARGQAADPDDRTWMSDERDRRLIDAWGDE